jgi:hypothetical protein
MGQSCMSYGGVAREHTERFAYNWAMFRRFNVCLISRRNCNDEGQQQICQTRV